MNDVANPVSPACASEFGSIASETRGYLQSQMMIVALTHNFHWWHFPLSECFAAAYGEAGSRRFWEVECSEPVSLPHFIRLLTVTVEPEDFSNQGRPDLEKQARDVALRVALIAAYQADPDNRIIFSGNLSSLQSAQYGHQLRGELKVDVRKAAEWLLKMPKRRVLVPTSLADFLSNKDRVRPDEPSYSEADDELVADALRCAYSEGDGPNVKLAYARAIGWLRDKGYKATREHIDRIGERAEFANQRGKPGVQKSRQRPRN